MDDTKYIDPLNIPTGQNEKAKDSCDTNNAGTNTYTTIFLPFPSSGNSIAIAQNWYKKTSMEIKKTNSMFIP